MNPASWIRFMVIVFNGSAAINSNLAKDANCFCMPVIWHELSLCSVKDNKVKVCGAENLGGPKWCKDPPLFSVVEVACMVENGAVGK